MGTPELSVLRAQDGDVDRRDELSGVYGVVVLCSTLFDGRPSDEVLNTAARAVQSLSTCCAEAAYRVVDGSLVDAHDPDRRLDGRIDCAVATTIDTDHEIELPDSTWRYAITLRTMRTVAGVLVVRAEKPASALELVSLKVLAQQAAVAMENADLLDRERRQRLQLRDLGDEHAKTNRRLSSRVTALERRLRVHEAMTAVSAAGTGADGIANALHGLTSLPVSIEDKFGNLRAWSPAPAPATYRAVDGRSRDEVLHGADAGGHSRHGDRVFSVIRPKSELLGVVVLHDPDRRADQVDEFALEHAAAVLAVELTHQRSLAETELRLRRNLVDDLLAGTDDESAHSRGEALGVDLRTPRRVTILQWTPEVDAELVARAATRWATAAGLHPLSARRASETILLTEDLPEPPALHHAVSAAVGNGRGWIAVGSLATSPSALPRSFAEARRTLRMQKASAGQYGSRRFDDLGVCRILDPGDNGPAVRGFLSEWLGPLMAYDRERNTDLVYTLARYLDSGGNYDLTARVLNIHRSTLRYRLGRIRDISGRDLQDVNSRLNLHLATRVYDMIGTVDTGTCPP